MTRKSRNIISGIDWWTIGIFFTIALFGWLNIYGSSYSFDQTSIWDFSNRAGKQLVWIGTALVLGTIILMIEEQAYEIKRLKMENKLLRDFLQLTGRK